MLHLFTHIQKTGGTSFKRSVIDQNVDPQQVYRYKGLRAFARDRLAGFAFVDGHFPYGIHRFTRQECVYYTILRNPVDQAISYYYFVKQCDKPHWKHPRLEEATQLGLVEFTRRHANMQTRVVAGFPWNRMFRKSSPRLLSIAKKNLLNKYLCYGLLEDLEGFEKKISGIFDWKYDPVYEQTKKTRNRPHVDDLKSSEYSAIVKIQESDMGLYEFAQCHVDEKVPVLLGSK